MVNLTFVDVALVGCAVSLAVFSIRRPYFLSTRLLPPGPPSGWLGSVTLPKTFQWLTYAQWKAIYGDIIYLRVFGNPIMVINSFEVAEELLEKRSSIYSSRPTRTMVVELMGWDWLFSSMPYGQRWRDHRMLFHQHFRPNVISQYHPIILEETHVILRNLLKHPDDFARHIRRTAAAIIMRISYGHKISDQGDIYVTLADEAMQGLAKAGIFGTFLVDYLPLLKYVPSFLPGASFKKEAAKWRKATRAMIDRPFQMVKDCIREGNVKPSFTSRELESWHQTGGNPAQETLIKNVAGISYAAGADTTVSTLLSFVLAMAVYPEVQAQAQKAVDQVLDGKRLPTFNDKDDLACVTNLVWEALRWNPVLPLGLAHYATEDDEYNGYWIPKGTSVLPNVWAMLHDEVSYPDPMIFNPDRFLEANQKKGANRLPQIAFGFGRRICPGRWMALDSVWLAIASILCVYDIQRVLDDNGQPVIPDTTYTSALLSRPLPFQCRFVPRSEAAIKLIQDSNLAF